MEEGNASFIIRAEALYHDLAANSKEAFTRFQQTFDLTTTEWRLAQAEHLLQLAEEQAWTLSEKELEARIPDYVKYACVAQQAGYDGLEIMGFKGYLIIQFIVSKNNNRTDG